MSGALVLVGEPGIGKTALLEHAAAHAAGFRVLRARGVQSEAELPFAALLEVCRPILAGLERLEPRQAQALRAALGLSDEQATTPFAIGAATLSLLAAAAEERPLLLLVDDAHWLDRASADAFAFAIRRLHADAVAALFAMRPGEGRAFSGHQLPELELQGLDLASAAELLADMRSELDPAERAAVLALADGNPLGLLELPRDAANTDPHAEPVRVGKELGRAFRARAESLPEPTRHALVVAAAASPSDLGVMQKALESCGLSLDTLEPAEAAGLLVLGAGALEFRHSLIRSALYHGADPADRRRAHAALAAALTGDHRGAWHLAAAAVGPDAHAAAALEHAAERATQRSGFAAAAAAYERAARLSEPGEDRLRRLSAAADSAWLAGRTANAVSLIEEALAHTGDDPRRGELLYLRGTIEHFGGFSADAAATLDQASALLAASNAHLACLSLTQANGSLLAAGEVQRAVALSERLAEIADPAQPAEFLLASLGRGSALLMDGRPEEGLPFLRDAAETIRKQELSSDPRNLPWAAMAADWLGDVASMASYAAAASRRALGKPPLLRDAPASATAPELIEALIRAGDADAAAELLEPFSDEAGRIGQPYPQAVALRCRGLLAAEDAYESEFERALEHHALDANIFATARTRLAYGERLRRSGRRIDARSELKQAIVIFDRLDAAPWSERARSELRATGERVGSRGPATRQELTPQELQVA